MQSATDLTVQQKTETGGVICMNPVWIFHQTRQNFPQQPHEAWDQALYKGLQVDQKDPDVSSCPINKPSTPTLFFKQI